MSATKGLLVCSCCVDGYLLFFSRYQESWLLLYTARAHSMAAYMRKTRIEQNPKHQNLHCSNIGEFTLGLCEDKVIISLFWASMMSCGCADSDTADECDSRRVRKDVHAAAVAPSALRGISSESKQKLLHLTLPLADTPLVVR